MREIDVSSLTQAVHQMVIQANRNLPSDVVGAIASAKQTEAWPLAQSVLSDMTYNAALAKEHTLPICQDTGLVCVFLEVGREVHFNGDPYQAINLGVASGYREGYLRFSVVADPIRRVNTGDNTPAMIDVTLVAGDEVKITVAPKGFGSENMSRLKMLRPSDGIDGVFDFVRETVKLAGPNACPPIIVGVGIGGTFDQVARSAKHALMRAIGTTHPDPYYAELERAWLNEINNLGIGPMGYGGATTALAVHINTLPTHIAGLPVAVNLNCHVTRHVTEVI